MRTDIICSQTWSFKSRSKPSLVYFCKALKDISTFSEAPFDVTPTVLPELSLMDKSIKYFIVSQIYVWNIIHGRSGHW